MKMCGDQKKSVLEDNRPVRVFRPLTCKSYKAEVEYLCFFESEVFYAKRRIKKSSKQL